MSAISEKIELLGKGLYSGIPDVLTIRSIPTALELELVGAEDFDAVMIDKILPAAVEEKIDFKQLLEIDYYWLCRALRMLNYGPYHTTNAIFCSKCGKTSYGEYSVDLRSVACKSLPAGFVNDVVVTKDEFIDYKYDVHMKLPTIQDVLNMKKDKAFRDEEGKLQSELARLCYMITEINGKNTLTPIEKRMVVLNDLSAADYYILTDVARPLVDYGLRAGGVAQCPNCRDMNAGFIAISDDRFFRPALGDLRRWKHDRSEGEDKDLSGSKTTTVRKHS